MGWIKSIGMGLNALLTKRRIESELDEEIEAFAAASTAEKQRRGIAAEQAYQETLIELGSRNSIKHQIWTSRWESRR